MPTLKVNIIGMGIMGKAAAHTLARNPNVEVTAIANRGEERRKEATQEFGIERTYTDYLEMLDKEKPDAVFIATPDWDHFNPVMACLDRGMHVHVEKPLTTDEGEARKIVEKVRETGLKLQVCYNHRWLAPYHNVKDRISSGEIGKPLTGYARKNNPISVPTKMLPSWAKESSPMWFQTSHDVDLMCWWFEDTPVEVKCFGVKKHLKEKFGWDTFDALQAIVQFSQGGIATFEAAWIYPETHPSMPDSFMSVIGETGHFQVDRKDETIEMSSEEKFLWPRSFLNYKVFDRWVGAFPSALDSFIDSILMDYEPHVDVLAGWKSTAVLAAMHESVETGETVRVKEAP